MKNRPSYEVVPNLHHSIWYGATVRGDVNKVTIGENTSIGDRAVVHVAKIQGDFATSIGSKVTVGPCAIIHAAKINDSVVVGASAQVLDGSVVESNSIISPGAVVTPGTTVAGGELWAGSPAKKVRALTQEEITSIGETASETLDLAIMHAEECGKDYQQISTDIEDFTDARDRHPDYIPRDFVDEGDVLGQGSPGRIFNSTLTHPEEGLKMKNEQK